MRRASVAPVEVESNSGEANARGMRFVDRSFNLRLQNLHDGR